MIGGRVTLALDPHALRRLAAGRSLALVSGTNGKTTASHLLASLLGGVGPVAHNATGANMPDGAVAALTASAGARHAVLEVDELHVAAVAEAVDPQVIVLLNLSRDQLDRRSDVRGVAAAPSSALIRHPGTLVVANVDDPMVVWAASAAARTVWVGAGPGWSGDTWGCPRCGEALEVTDERWRCGCGLLRPQPHWHVDHDAGTVLPPDGPPIPVNLQLPGRFNLSNAALALAAAAALGIDAAAAAGSVAALDSVGGRYRTVQHRGHELRLLLAKNPAGWVETLSLLEPAAALLLVVNAHEADGRDTSWLWDVPFEQLAPAGTGVVAAGEKAADLGLRLSYAGVDHVTVTNPLDALARLPPGKVDVVANYTAFRRLARRIGDGAA
jgi:UDP-N-acetylmuramyl tripeptide synthase